MSNIIIKETPAAVAQAAAELAAQALAAALQQTELASFVLAGGSLPPVAYGILGSDYSSALDWSKVQFLIGDERCVPLDDPDSSWPLANDMLSMLSIPANHQLRPKSDLSAESAAADYAQVIANVPRFDHFWFGMGEDGHTLSLFPGHPSLQPTDDLVIPVHDSPKPPPDRISFSLKALERVGSAVALITGDGKAEVIAKAAKGDTSLPIVLATQAIEQAGGSVTWLLDTAAARLL